MRLVLPRGHAPCNNGIVKKLAGSVELADKHHPTKARVIALLQGAKCRVSCCNAGGDVIHVQSESSDGLEQGKSNDRFIFEPIL